MGRTIKETDLFEPVKKFFENAGYEVYSEVLPRHYSKRADIVAIKGSIIVTVELKTSLSLDLIDQAIHWKPYAHHVYVAVPTLKPYCRHRGLASRILRSEGIGLLEVWFPGLRYASNADEEPIVMPNPHCPPTLNRRILTNIRDTITPYHKKNPLGGSSRAKHYMTEYRLTMTKVQEFLQHRMPQQWTPINEILEHCQTHYAQPRQSLARALLHIESDWCESKKIDGKLHFRAKKRSDRR